MIERVREAAKAAEVKTRGTRRDFLWALLVMIPVYVLPHWGNVWIQDHGHKIVDHGRVVYNIRTLTVPTDNYSITAFNTLDIENMSTGEQWHFEMEFTHHPRGMKPSRWEVRDYPQRWRPALPGQWPPGEYLSRFCRRPVIPLPWPWSGMASAVCTTSTFVIEEGPMP